MKEQFVITGYSTGRSNKISTHLGRSVTSIAPVEVYCITGYLPSTGEAHQLNIPIKDSHTLLDWLGGGYELAGFVNTQVYHIRDVRFHPATNSIVLHAHPCLNSTHNFVNSTARHHTITLAVSDIKPDWPADDVDYKGITRVYHATLDVRQRFETMVSNIKKMELHSLNKLKDGNLQLEWSSDGQLYHTEFPATITSIFTLFSHCGSKLNNPVETLSVEEVSPILPVVLNAGKPDLESTELTLANFASGLL